MESEAPVSLSLAQGNPSPPSQSAPVSSWGSPPTRIPTSSQENGSDSSSHVESSVNGEDGFETASEEGPEDSAALTETLLPEKTAMPFTEVSQGDVVEEEVADEDPRSGGKSEVLDGENTKGVSGQNPNLEKESKVSTEGLVSTDSAHSGDISPRNSKVGDAVETELKLDSGDAIVDGAKENGVSDAQDVKDENFGDAESDVAANRALEVEVESKPEKMVSGAAEGEKDCDREVEAESKPVKMESDAVEGEKEGGVTDTAGSEQNLDRTAESKPVEVEFHAVEAKQIGADDVIDSNQNPNGAVGSKVVETEPNAVEAEEKGATDSNKEPDTAVDGAAESKVVETEPDAVEAEEKGATDSKKEPDAAVDGAAELKVVETEPDAAEFEKNGTTDDATSDRSLEMVNNPTSETLESESTDSKNVAQGPENDVGLSGNSIPVDSGEAIDGSSSPNQQIDEEKVLTSSEDASNDLKAKHEEPEPELDAGGGDLISVEDVEPQPILAADSISRESEREYLDNSGVIQNENTSGITTDSLPPISVSDQKVKPDSANEHENHENLGKDEAEEYEDGADSDKTPRIAILDSSETAKQIIKEMEGVSSRTSSQSGFESSQDFSRHIDGQIMSDSDEEADRTDEDGDGQELFDSATLAALLKAATGASSDGNITITSQDGARVFSVDRPAGLGSSAPSLRPAPPRSTRQNLFTPTDLAVAGEADNTMDEEEKKLHEKVEEIRVKFLRLVMRLGHSPEDTVAAQVLYRLSLAEGIRHGRQMSRGFSLESAKKKALQLEEERKEDLNFSCNILVLGKTGVGKSATINSIFGEEKSHTNAFDPATVSVREICGVVDGVKIRVIDTPGLRASVMEQAANRKILSSIKKYTKKCPPDIVLYVDRLDTQTRDFNDLPLLKSITSILGSSIWFNAIVALTHAASAPPEGANGTPLSYEVFIAQRSHVVQHSIRQAAGDMRLMNPVALVENHPSCRRNREGERVLPNGLSWRPQMLLLCYSSKILSEANSLLKLQDPSPGKLFGFRLRSPPLPFLLSSLLQSRPHPKLPTEQGADNGDSDIDLDDFSDAEEEEEDEYDQLPPFKPLKKSQIAKLTKEQKRAYFDEYDYRVRLLQKKQWKDELRRLKEMKKRGKNGQESRDETLYGDMGEDFDQDGAPAAVPVPLPDMVLPPSFDCEVPTYRYRFLEPTSQLLTRPVLDTHGWDHDCGYDGVSLEESLAIASRFPATVAVQITKDKKEFNIHLDSSIAAKHGENGSTLAGFDIQSVGKQLAYILRSETKFKNLKKNKTAAGISVTFLGETVATGLKVEDQVSIGKRVSLVASTGAVRAQGDVAYGANLEARLREKDYPIGQALSTLGLSLMKWRGDLALGANLQSQFSVGRNSKMAVRVGLNNKLSGQITVRTSTSEQLQLALVGILPVAVSIFRSIWPGESYLAH